MKKMFMLCIPILLLSLGGCKKAPAQRETVTVAGSTTMLPIVNACAAVYMEQHNVKISVTGGQSGSGFTGLLAKTIDIATLSRNMKNTEIKQAKELGIAPYEIMIAKDALAIVVHPNLTGIETLTIEQLRRIYKGEIKNWQELGGPKAEIILISREAASGTFETFESKVMNKEKSMPTIKKTASHQALSQAVSSTPGSIGYISIGFISESVKVLKVEGIEPSLTNVQAGSYPLYRGLFMYTNGAPAGPVKKFVDFVLSNEGQELITRAGFIPRG